MKYEIGKITSWNDKKGFGFISSDSGGKSVFIHMNDFSKRHKRPVQGLSVVYSLSKDSRGRVCATNVYPEKGHKEVTTAGKQKVSAIIICSAFIMRSNWVGFAQQTAACYLRFVHSGQCIDLWVICKRQIGSSSREMENF
jgi:cold shock CspA family protein